MINRNIGILGSTGSIGTQALEVIRENADRFKVSFLTAQFNAELLIKQAIEFMPSRVVICAERHFSYVNEKLSPLGIEVLAGVESLFVVAADQNTDMVLSALVGFAGLQPTIAAIKAGKDIALANKETLVVAGELVMELAKQHCVKLLPVDSEHSAIFQCLIGEERNPVEKIYLTASGGPFRGRDVNFLANITKTDALKHPNWVMGAKVTIDSATLMNKGLEVIEAKWLFDLKIPQIDVIIHPQSVVHSIVQFEDGSMKAQMGLPDMKLPIQYALGYPQRISNNFPRFNFLNYPNLSFEKPDSDTFKNLALAYSALEKGGNMPCILNAANEVVVTAFLDNKVGFLQMSDIIQKCMKEITYVSAPGLSDYMETDCETRIFARKLVTNR
ncbi:MAG TPA: 1-deoxy-D-xylulose-5-phosphate reductoisomerase [Sphingobacteriaceae bacterium]|nr:1-deoxy-D-xylulose-5-phosphate reductoisomerase [Sphingobacteriaceae bacterium]